MIEPFIAARVQDWLASPRCQAKPLLAYMRAAGKLRDVQIAALQTYLYLLLEGQNQTLAQLWMQGIFAKAATYDGPRSRMPKIARDVFAAQPGAHTWYQLCQSQSPALASWLEENADAPNYPALTRELFYGWDNTDYVFSLPMGSGKTWLMAAIMYLNLYLGEQHLGDDRFAQNFCVLIPSAKKSSLLPSLRSIERFDPAWVLPEPAAGRLRQRLIFEVLDAPKTSAKSNQIRTPNARKVAQHLMHPGLTGLVLVVNAEKVILDRIDDSTDVLIEKTEDERDQAANELRALIGQVPKLQLMVDEVHGAATSEIKLRQVMHRWHNGGNVHSVVGFSGTPFLDKPQEIAIGHHTLKQRQMSTVVFHYALTDAVRTFLKQPAVETAFGLTAEQIVRRGTEEFLSRYGHTVYPTGCSAKLAIYCGSIERLETEVAPIVQQFFPGQVLKYHRGNAHYKAPAHAEAQFSALDSPTSPHRVVLLVQIGKEGWDCHSLTSVILAQKGDSPTNMVLQSACRCLREVVRGQRHTALIYLSQDNAQILEAQLKNSQNTCIAALNAAAQTQATTVPEVQKIVAADAQGQRGTDIAQADETAFATARALLEQQGLGHMLLPESAAAERATKDQTFHYLPYDFAQSGLELGLLQALLKATEFQASGLKVYYNGARHLTEFRIDCYQQVGNVSKPKTQRWQRLGAYTPDFVMLQRGADGAAHKVLMIETKGSGFSEQTSYALRKRFVSTEFLQLNNAKFGYPRFDFIEVMEPDNKDYRSTAFALLRHAQRFFAPQQA